MQRPAPPTGSQDTFVRHADTVKTTRSLQLAINQRSETRKKRPALAQAIPETPTAAYVIKKLSSGETIAKKEHTWVKQDNIPATCEKGEMEVEKCSVCGETKETEISDPLGHDYGEWVVIKKPTCTKYGLNKRYCKRCMILK